MLFSFNKSFHRVQSRLSRIFSVSIEPAILTMKRLIITQLQSIHNSPRREKSRIAKQSTMKLVANKKITHWTMRNHRWTSPIYPQKLYVSLKLEWRCRICQQRGITSDATENRHKFPKMIIKREKSICGGRTQARASLRSFDNENIFGDNLRECKMVKWLWSGHFVCNLPSTTPRLCIFMNI